MRPHVAHIARKRGWFYYRRRLPGPHHRREISLGLGTRLYRLAEHLAGLLDRGWDDAMTTIERTHPDLGAVVGGHLRRLLEVDRRLHFCTPAGMPLYGVLAGEGDTPRAADLRHLDRAVAVAEAEFLNRDLGGIASSVNHIAPLHGVPEEHHVALGLGLLRAELEFWKTARERRLHGMAPPPEPETAGGTVPGAAPTVMAPPVASAIEVTPAFVANATPPKPVGGLLSVEVKHLAVMMRDGRVDAWTERTKAHNMGTYRMFAEALGDRPVADYTRSDVGAFFNLLFRLPAKWDKDKRFRHLGLRGMADEVDRVDAAGGSAPVRRLTMKTLKRHMSALATLFAHLAGQGKCAFVNNTNPAHGHTFPRSRRLVKAERRAWTSDRLAALFRSPVYTGCHGEHFRARPGRAIVRDERYWLPLIAVCSGMRLEEIAQLTRSDVREVEDVPVFDINREDGKATKNAQSVRLVPIHTMLLKLGFLRYVETVTDAPGDRVFPLLRPGGPDRRFGYKFTSWFTTYRRLIGVYEPGLDFHSFRHAVQTQLGGYRIEQRHIDQLFGHEGQESEGARRYNKGAPIKELQRIVNKLRWPEIEAGLASAPDDVVITTPSTRRGERAPRPVLRRRVLPSTGPVSPPRGRGTPVCRRAIAGSADDERVRRDDPNHPPFVPSAPGSG